MLSLFNGDMQYIYFIICVAFTRISASNAESDDVTIRSHIEYLTQA